MRNILRRYVVAMLPKHLRWAFKRWASTMFHGKSRARLRFATCDKGEELIIDDISLILPPPRVTGASRWLARHPEDVLELEVFLRLAKQANGVLFDVGAHIGRFAVLFCKACEHNAVAFEPAPESQRIIEHMANLNGVADRIQVIGMALGSEVGVTNMHLDEATGFVQVQKYESSHASSGVSISAPTSTIDSIRSTLKTKVALLKIDVEGFEGEVLQGGQHTLSRDRPIVAVEIHNEYLAERGINLRNVLNRVVEQRYSLMRLNGRCVTAAAAARTFLSRSHLIAVPMEELSRYKRLLAG